jgi:hypothetical protein
MARYRLPALLVAALAWWGCQDSAGVNCTDEMRPAILLELIDADTGQPPAPQLFVAVAAARSGEYADTVAAVKTTFGLAYEQPGTYHVWVDGDGWARWDTSRVRVTEDECHVRTVKLVARMDPIRGGP